MSRSGDVRDAHHESEFDADTDAKYLVALRDVLVAAGRVDDADFDAIARVLVATLATASRADAVDASRAAVALAAACPSRAGRAPRTTGPRRDRRVCRR